jgi:C4-dicarboxylate-specific signal transduction histidine kinase
MLYRGRIWLTLEREAAEVRVVVKGIGTGIPPEMLHKVIVMFTHFDESLERFDG